MIGDFNETVYDQERSGGRSLMSQSKSYLEDFMQISGCVDLGFQGNKYTWRNKRGGLEHIRRRLDRAIASLNWRMVFPRAELFICQLIS